MPLCQAYGPFGKACSPDEPSASILNVVHSRGQLQWGVICVDGERVQERLVPPRVVAPGRTGVRRATQRGLQQQLRITLVAVGPDLRHPLGRLVAR